METIGYGPPVFYDHQNAYNSTRSPSTMHSSDTWLQWYFRRYLLQKAIAVFKWDLPKLWAKNYFLYVLYCWGYIAVVNTDKFGVICQACSLSGYDLYYQPNKATIANPLLRGILNPVIDKQCTLIRLQPCLLYLLRLRVLTCLTVSYHMCLQLILNLLLRVVRKCMIR